MGFQVEKFQLLPQKINMGAGICIDAGKLIHSYSYKPSINVCTRPPFFLSFLCVFVDECLSAAVHKRPNTLRGRKRRSLKMTDR